MSTFLPSYTALGSFGVYGTYTATWEVIWNAPQITASTALFWLEWDQGSALTVFTSFKFEAGGTSQTWNWPFLSKAPIYSTTALVSGSGKLGFKQAVQSYTVWAPFNVAMASFEGESEGREDPQPDPNASMMLNTLPKKGAVVYDSTTGEIKHLHRVTAFSADQLPNTTSVEAEALRLGKQHSRETFPAAVLSINLDTLKEETSYKVDLATRTLQELPADQTMGPES